MFKTKTFTVCLITVLSACFSQHTYSQIGNEHSLLWEISGNGMRNNAYLYGTIHYIEVKDFFVTDAVKEKFGTCKILATENAAFTRYMSIESINKIERRAFLPPKTTIFSVMEREDSLKLHAYMKASLTKNEYKAYIRLKPFYLAGALQSKKLGKVKTTGYELYFWQSAFDRNKAKKYMTIVGLEEYKHTLASLDSVSTKDQISSLMNGINSGFSQFNKIVAAYKAQDITELYEMSLSYNGEDEIKILLDNRNLKWIPKIEQLIHTQPTFIAVGAAHLDGEKD